MALYGTVPQYLHFRILEFPLRKGDVTFSDRWAQALARSRHHLRKLPSGSPCGNVWWILRHFTGLVHPGQLDDTTHKIHGAAIYANMDPINIPQMLAYIPYMDPMGDWNVWERT